MDIARSFSYPRKDQQAVSKLLIGAALNFFSWLIVPGIAVAGYLLEVTRRAAQGADDGLPAWDDWGDTLLAGVLVSLIAFLYSLVPMALFAVGLGSLVMSVLFGAHSHLAASVLAGGALSATLGGIGLLLGFLLSFVTPAIYMRFAVTRDFASAFNPALIVSDITRGLGHYLLIWGVMMGVGMAMALFTVITSGIGALLCLPLGFYAAVAVAHMKGQYWRTYLA